MEKLLNKQFDTFEIYEDIKHRTNGEIYIGVVGPVRTGKSTFIKNFMETLVIPQITDNNDKMRAIDELPQSGTGKTITTTEPKFIPKEAVNIELSPKQSAKVRLIDCVGYMIDGASGHLENEQERMVKTPWSENEIPFSQAAKIGTKKVITDHSTIGLVITTDGSISDIPRDNYKVAEDTTITELKKMNKPFLVLVNSTKPYSEECKNIVNEIKMKHNVCVMSINCIQLKRNDILKIMEKILSVFPISQINFTFPDWCKMIDDESPIKKSLHSVARDVLSQINIIDDAVNFDTTNIDNSYIEKTVIETIDLKNGEISIILSIANSHYYDMLTKMTGVEITNEYQLVKIIKELSSLKETMDNLSASYEKVQSTGYSVIPPSKNDIAVEKPELIKHGNKYGIKITATATSIHMIKAPIETEIAPIVGTMEQAQDLINYINNTSLENDNGIWNTNIFGKSVEQLINEGIDLKINKITDDTREKMQDTLKKIVNESNGTVICIIL